MCVSHVCSPFLFNLFYVPLFYFLSFTKFQTLSIFYFLCQQYLNVFLSIIFLLLCGTSLSSYQSASSLFLHQIIVPSFYLYFHCRYFALLKVIKLSSLSKIDNFVIQILCMCDSILIGILKYFSQNVAVFHNIYLFYFATFYYQRLFFFFTFYQHL